MKPLTQSLKTELRRGRGRNLKQFIAEGLRRKLRCVIWHQWKRVHTRAKNLMTRELDEATAWRSAINGRGLWWNAGARHMNFAFPVPLYFQ